MRRILTTLTIGVALFALPAASHACAPLTSNIHRALAPNDPQRSRAIVELRDEGPAALRVIAEMRDAAKKHLAAATPETEAMLLGRVAELDKLLDEVGGARYCSVSELYWFTDLDKAKAYASLLNKPILSLRMLGNLNEEFSCANSRFFRTTLYANTEIASILREKFVLHWESVRPVPRVTIDFGDGRKLERTLTGNSIHYVLDKNGRPLDGLPGLHGPAAFKAWLAQAEKLATDFAVTRDEAATEAFLRDYHRQRQQQVSAAFAADLQRARAATEVQPAVQALAAPDAKAAAGIAVPKRRAEIRIIREVAVDRSLPSTMDELDEATWQRIAALHADDSQLDATSVALIKAENPNAVIAGKRAVTKAFVEDPLAKLVRTFQTSIALDTVRNEYVLHRQLHQWFAEGNAEADLRALNERVYAQLFLTPSSDPWLGLVTPDTYTALNNGGVEEQQSDK